MAALASAMAWDTVSIQREATSAYSPRCSVALAVWPPQSRNESPPSPCHSRPLTCSMRSEPILEIVEAALASLAARWDAPAVFAECSRAASCSWVMDSKSVRAS
ncbi:hypothetical protein [Streptomyces sp. Tu 6176]|uniref:hypothetical protein n=1 Tax=Streptomyces sp. Tu 6176 TaxID=1470557 RepID=UPI001F2B5764|nr:hypothetical protein [Streptomyces sp. Tu 6176]